MDLKELRAEIGELKRTKKKARALGQDLELQFEALLNRVRPGEQDPVLLLLAGDELASLAQGTKWSTLVINPGSTSTKVAVYSGLMLVAEEEVPIDPWKPGGILSRTAQVVEWIRGLGLNFEDLTGIAARGGFVAPVPVATYRISETMCDDLEKAPLRHPSNMAVPMALELGKLVGPDVVLTITDPVTCDEIDPKYRITGSSKLRTDGSAVHYLNLRAVCELTARLLQVDRSELNLVACHMGGGMSAVRYEHGTMAQVLAAFGTFPSANRSGSLPLKEIIRLADSKEYGFDDLKADVVEGKGGLLGLTGTNDFKALFEFERGDADPKQKEKIALVTEFFAGRVAAGILELTATDKIVDAILLTGGLARDARFCKMVADKIHLPIPVVRIPGSIESQSLASGLLRAAADPLSRHNYVEARDRLAAQRAQEDELFDVTIFDRPPGLVTEQLDSLKKIEAAFRKSDAMQTVAVVGGDNEDAMLAAKLANQQGDEPLARFVFIGSFSKISNLAWELDVPIDEETFFIVDADDPTKKAMELFREGIVDVMMKGSETSASILKGYLECLKAMGQIPKGSVLSHVSLFELPGRQRFVAITDAAINPNPNVKTREVILENVLEVMKTLGVIKPKVALIAPTEKPSAKVASSMESEEISNKYRDRDDVVVDGPVSVDLALSPGSAKDKNYQGRIQGDADVLVVPSLDVGNAVYKSFTVTGGATVAGAVIGCGPPLILTSRGDSSRTKFASIALALVLRERGGVR